MLCEKGPSLHIFILCMCENRELDTNVIISVIELIRYSTLNTFVFFFKMFYNASSVHSVKEHFSQICLL